MQLFTSCVETKAMPTKIELFLMRLNFVLHLRGLEIIDITFWAFNSKKSKLGLFWWSNQNNNVLQQILSFT